MDPGDGVGPDDDDAEDLAWSPRPRQRRRLSREYLTLAHLNQAVVRAADEQELYGEACRIAVEDGGYLGAWVGTAERPDGKVRAVAVSGEARDFVEGLALDLDPRGPGGLGPTVSTFRQGVAQVSADARADLRPMPWYDDAMRQGIRSLATLPLNCEGRTVAVLTLYSDRPGAFDDLVVELLGQLAENVSYALGTFAARRRVAEYARQRADLLRRLVDAQEAERARIAADVHDHCVQTMAAVDLRLGLLRTRVSGQPDLAEATDTLQRLVEEASVQLRRLLGDLEPALEPADLADSVGEVAAAMLEGTPTVWSVVTDGPVRLSTDGRTQALRVVKEALANVRQHAGADEVTLRLASRSGGVRLSVHDDGRGAPGPDLRPEPGKRGVQTMIDRAEASGGWCRVTTGPGRGTTVELWLPAGAPGGSPAQEGVGESADVPSA